LGALVRGGARDTGSSPVGGRFAPSFDGAVRSHDWTIPLGGMNGAGLMGVI